MNSLDMTEAKAKNMSEIEDLSLETIQQALSDEVEADDEKVKVAVKMMGVVAKNRQTLTNRAAVEFGMARSIATEKELHRYVTVTSPQIQKALGKKQ